DSSDSPSSGFGTSTNAAPRATSSGFGTTSSESASFGAAGKAEGKYSTTIVRFVERQISQGDKNKNGYLDKDEWGSMRWGGG
ncbi:MAG: hypothetical protein KDA87_21630, partial [Planctomycetales bacterium]|nr:hypothetical protein [Planctomycetales bacterium]